MNYGESIYNTLREIFPINRSITGNGVRKTLKILSSICDINTLEIPSGTKAFDWVVPKEWNINGAYIERINGQKLIDFEEHNLHVVGYSEPIERIVSKNELMEHIHYIEDKPDYIPYITSYYKRNWGFCVKYKDLGMFSDDKYYVKIDSSFVDGSLTIGEIIIPGKSKKEILLSTNICHPSMANNEASGPSLVIHLAKYIKEKMPNRKYTYRILFLPETIGSITYLSKNLKEMKENTLCGYTVSCVGDEGRFSYLKSIKNNSFVNKVTEYMLKNVFFNYNIYEFTERGSDERQYCFPGIDLDIGSIMRSKYNTFDQYHTSGDDLSLVTASALEASFLFYLKCLKAIESIDTYRCTTLCEPVMGRHGLYPTTSTTQSLATVKDMRNVMTYCNGERDTLDITNILNISLDKVTDMANKLLECGLIK